MRTFFVRSVDSGLVETEADADALWDWRLREMMRVSQKVLVQSSL